MMRISPPIRTAVAAGRWPGGRRADQGGLRTAARARHGSPGSSLYAVRVLVGWAFGACLPLRL